jgi:SOS response regulatory protein OraA/RecX
MRDRGQPRIRSRVHGSRRIVQELRRLLIKTHRCAMGRVLTDDEQKWCMRVTEFLDRLITEGDLVVAGLPDPRDAQRARKSPGYLF